MYEVWFDRSIDIVTEEFMDVVMFQRCPNPKIQKIVHTSWYQVRNEIYMLRALILYIQIHWYSSTR